MYKPYLFQQNTTLIFNDSHFIVSMNFSLQPGM